MILRGISTEKIDSCMVDRLTILASPIRIQKKIQVEYTRFKEFAQLANMWMAAQ